MTEDQKKKLEAQLWNIANTLRGKMNAGGFRDYILGFIFYKYLSKKCTSMPKRYWPKTAWTVSISMSVKTRISNFLKPFAKKHSQSLAIF